MDFEQELYNRFGQVKDFTLGMRIAKYFYELGKQSGNSEIPNDLEEAAEKFARFYDQGTCDGIAQDCFIAGAKWQKEQMLKEAAEAWQENETGLINVTVKVSPYLAPTILLDEFTRKIFTDNIVKALEREYHRINGEDGGGRNL